MCIKGHLVQYQETSCKKVTSPSLLQDPNVSLFKPLSSLKVYFRTLIPR